MDDWLAGTVCVIVLVVIVVPGMVALAAMAIEVISDAIKGDQP